MAAQSVVVANIRIGAKIGAFWADPYAMDQG